MFELELYDEEKHYDVIASWFYKRMNRTFRKELFPSYGLIVKENGNMVCGTWASMDNAKSVAFQLFTISNPYEFNQLMIIHALDHLNASLAIQLDEMGYTHIIALSANEPLCDFYKQSGYSLIERRVSVFLKEID